MTDGLQSELALLLSDTSWVERRRVLADVLKSRKLNKIATTRQFAEFVEALLEPIGSGATNDRSVLESLAILGRINASSPKVRKVGEAQIRTAITGEIAVPFAGSKDAIPFEFDAEDRKYILDCVAMASGDWIARYCAEVAVLEESGESVRTVAIAELFRRVDTISDALQMLAEAWAKISVVTQNPAESRILRMRRLFTAIRPQITNVAVLPGQNVGRVLAGLFGGTASVKEREGLNNHALTVEFLEDSAGLVYDLLRTQFELATDATVYKSMATLREWFAPGDWQVVAADSASMDRIADYLIRVVYTLAKQGIKSDDLFDQLRIITGSGRRARPKVKALVGRDPDLPNDIRNWLEGGTEPLEAAHRIESSASEEDQDKRLALILLRAMDVKGRLELLSGTVISGLRMTDPITAAALDELAASCDRMVNVAKEAAVRRRMRLFSLPGEIVKYSPGTHQFAESSRTNTATARVVTPGVEMDVASDRTRVLIKAVVDPV